MQSYMLQNSLCAIMCDFTTMPKSRFSILLKVTELHHLRCLMPCALSLSLQAPVTGYGNHQFPLIIGETGGDYTNAGDVAFLQALTNWGTSTGDGDHSWPLLCLWRVLVVLECQHSWKPQHCWPGGLFSYTVVAACLWCFRQLGQMCKKVLSSWTHGLQDAWPF